MHYSRTLCLRCLRITYIGIRLPWTWCFLPLYFLPSCRTISKELKIMIRKNLQISDDMRLFGKQVISPFSMQVSHMLYTFGLNAALFVFCTKDNIIRQSRMQAANVLIVSAINGNVLNYPSDESSNHSSNLEMDDYCNLDVNSDTSYATWPTMENIERDNALRKVYAQLSAAQRTISNEKEVYSFVYISFAERRQKLLVFAGFLVAHLGVFAFLIQVFDDRGIIMQVRCYSQLGLLLLCFILYILTYIWTL